MRLGLIGDVHAEDRHLEWVLGVLKKAGVERILCTGDVVDGKGDADRCCRLLQEASVLTVRGNHDRWLLTGYGRDLPNATPVERIGRQSKRFLEELPPTAELITPAGRLLLCHGIGANDMACIRPNDTDAILAANRGLQSLGSRDGYRFVVNGHSHERMVRRIGSFTLINAGTLERSRDPCCAVLECSLGQIVFRNLIPRPDRELLEIVTLP